MSDLVIEPPQPLDKTNVKRFERLYRPIPTLIKLLKRSGMNPQDAKLYASNFTYPQVADDIYNRIRPFWKEKPALGKRDSSRSRRSEPGQ